MLPISGFVRVTFDFPPSQPATPAPGLGAATACQMAGSGPTGSRFALAKSLLAAHLEVAQPTACYRITPRSLASAKRYRRAWPASASVLSCASQKCSGQFGCATGPVVSVARAEC